MNRHERLLVFAAIAVLVGGTAYDLYEFDTNAGPIIATLSTGATTYDQVARSYGDYLSLLNSSNIEALPSVYTSNETIVWLGRAPGLVGTYTGQMAIRELFNVFLTRNAPNLIISNETHTISAQGDAWIVNSTFDFGGNGTQFGYVHGRVQASYSYVEVGATWAISKEAWNFTEYTQQYPVG